MRIGVGGTVVFCGAALYNNDPTMHRCLVMASSHFGTYLFVHIYWLSIIVRCLLMIKYLFILYKLNNYK